MLKSFASVVPITLAVLLVAVFSLEFGILNGPIIVGLGLLPLLGLLVSRRPLVSAVPDLIFGAIDTGLLAIPAVFGALRFGVFGALAGGVVGDAVTDSIAGLFEGGIARWLRARGIDESRDPVTSSMGKMAGCLVGAGLVLSVFHLFGVTPDRLA
jgi:hypothetical protein